MPIVKFNEEKQIFYSDKFDYLESFGIVKNSKLFLTFEECFFMLQNYLINLEDEDTENYYKDNDNNEKNKKEKVIENHTEDFITQKTNSFLDILFSFNLHLDTFKLKVYSYLRRNGKIVLW